MSRSTSTIFSRKASPTINNGEALPWTLIGAALAAMAAAYFSSDRFVGLPALALLLVFSRFSSWRLPRHFLISYGLRALILAVVLTLINQTDVQDSTVWYLKQGDTNLASYALAADIVLRAWEKRPPKAAREGLGVVVLMTALLFAAATNTYDRLYIQLITPIYAVMLILSFRTFALMQQSARFAYSQRPGLVFLRGIAIVLTLAFAGAGVYAVTRYEYQVTNWAMQFVRQHHSEHHDIGFAASPRLSTVFNPDPSISRVLLIDGVISEPHLRAAAFDTYQNAQWSPPASDRLFGPISTGNDLPIASSHLLKIARLGDTADFIPAPLTSAQINSNDPLEQDNSGTVRDTRSGSSEPFDLLESSSPKFQGLLSVKPDAKTRGRLLAIGAEIDPRVVDLARKVAGTGERWTQVLRLQEYLRSHHAYALSFQPQGEPLSDFILNDRAAHCQYFASAMAIMARAIGVPARFVAGFYAHEPYGNGQTVVRQRDAHAWAECWLDDVGWITVDATPGGGRPDGLFPDPAAWRRWWEKLCDLPGEIRDWFSAHVLTLEKLAAAGAVGGFLVWLVRLALRRRPPVDASPANYPGPDEQLVQMAQRYERWMETRGIPCPPQSTWRSHLARHAERSPTGDEAELCEMFVRTYDRARFGSSDDQATEQAIELLNQIETGRGKHGSANR